MVTLLGLTAGTAVGQAPVIDSFGHDGELTCTNLTHTSRYVVERAPSASGPWTNASASLANVWGTSSGTMQVTVPMSNSPSFYRVVGPTNDYLVVDLSGGTNASSYPVSYLAGIPAGGWTNEHKTTKLVLRRIPAGTFTMGTPAGTEIGSGSDERPAHDVTLTQDFFAGIFEVTQRQWERVMGTWPSYFTNVTDRESRPVEQVSYELMRGTSAGAGWPADGNVDASSFMGRLRSKTGLAFDLPTESQWEYAGRAGTTTPLNSGQHLTHTDPDPHMDEVGRYSSNGGGDFGQSPWVGASNGTATVGTYAVNRWGLYDTHGNAYELCLDWYGPYPTGPVTDPRGATTNVLYRVGRGGAWWASALGCRIAERITVNPDHDGHAVGFRVTVPAGQR